MQEKVAVHVGMGAVLVVLVVTVVVVAADC
jgi:hypothetical protein